jgi:hypothetical protein
MADTPQRDLLIVILFMVALGVAWYYAGGTANDLARSGPLFGTPDTGSLSPVGIPGVKLNEADPDPVDTGPKTTTVTNYLGTFNEVESPYAKFVSLEKGTAESAIGSEYLTLRVAQNAPDKITVTGWRVESTATGVSASLPQAALLPFLGSVNAPAPVTLSGGQQVFIVTGRSPNGTSFRTNKCTGYFEQFQNFTPALRLECPGAQQEADAYFTPGNYTDGCNDIVRTIGRCVYVTQSIPTSAGSACATFIQDRLSYNGCINAHKNDEDFYKKDWYLYINRDQELWRSRSERIRLLDENGKVVDVVSY